MNGDGFADLLVGAPFADAGGAYSGASYVVFGRASGLAAALNVAALNGTDGFQIIGQSANDLSGFSVAGAGDVNGDGFADVVVGASQADPTGSYSGASYVVFGQAGGFLPTLNLSTLDGANGFQISGEAALDYSGFSVAGAGDVNGDGLADLIVGALGADPNISGASYVVFGRVGDFPAVLNLSTLNGTDGFQLSGEAEYGRRSG